MKFHLRVAVAAILATLCVTPSVAQTQWPTPKAGVPAQGYVMMCLNSSGFAVPVDQNGACPTGGGGSSGAVFGPTAAGSAAANPPIIIGGTADGTAAGNVTNWKVLSGIGYINCANCSGSGISVPFAGAIGANGTPGGFKDGSGNFQPLLGDVTNGQWVNIKSSVSLGVTGTFWQATQPVSAASLPLPNGAATAANQATEISSLATIATNTGAAIPAGSATIGAVMQASGPWTSNVTQFGGNNIATGTGTGGNGIPRVTVSSDSTLGLVAGTAIVGKVGIDQTTPGTTNGVAIVGVNGATALAGNGTTGTGSPRVTLSSDNSAVPLWGHGPVTPGTAATGSTLAGATYNSTAPTFTNGQQGPLQVSSRGGLLLGNGYPAGSTPITISGTGTTGATTATLATGASVTTYICGFSIRANATAVKTGNATVTGTITGTLNFTQWTAPNVSGLGVTEEIFTPCIPASAANTGIAVISDAPGTNGVVSVTAWGYTL